MQPEFSNPRAEPANEKATQQFHKNILRLALCFRTRSKEVDGLLNHLAKLSNEEKTKNIDQIAEDILGEIIALSENQAKADPLSKFALKLDSLGFSFTSSEKILDGEVDTANAESLAREIVETIESPDPAVSRAIEFYRELPVTEGLKREIQVLKDMFAQGQNKLDSLNALKAIVSQLYEQLVADTTEAPDGIALEKHANGELLLELMNLIDFPKSLRNRADVVRQKLSDAATVSELGALLNEISGLIEQTRVNLEAEIARLAAFLSNLFSRLEKLDGLLVEAASYQSESSINHNKLQRDFERHVSTMHDDLRTEGDIKQIRNLVSTRIDKLGSTINDYVALETKRQQEASTQVSEMSRTVRALESKTAQLNHDLEQQKRQLQTDPLTKILNRSGYQRILSSAISHFKNDACKFSLAVFDIDHFKRINDTFGHLAGDKVLQNLAQQVSNEIRATDSLCRYGGEEFVIIMPETDGPDAHHAMENLRAKVEKYHFHHNGTSVPVTISCGTTECRRDDDVESIFERADNALYRAKNSGRNKALLADS